MVSPVNARKQLSSLIRRAKKELLIYDPKIADPAILRALEERIEKGVDVKSSAPSAEKAMSWRSVRCRASAAYTYHYS